MALKTSQLIKHVQNSPEGVDFRLNLNGGLFTRHRFSDDDDDSIWHLSYCDDSQEVITSKNLLKHYPDLLGDIWTIDD